MELIHGERKRNTPLQTTLATCRKTATARRNQRQRHIYVLRKLHDRLKLIEVLSRLCPRGPLRSRY